MMLSMKKIFVAVLALLPALSMAQVTIMDIISRDLRFSTLVTLLTAARLTGDLGSTSAGPFTLFAPVNIAFVNSRVNVTRLLLPMWNAHLTDLLQYHVAQQEIWASDLELNDEIVTVNGEVVDVTSANPYDLILNDNATVFEADKLASNGVVQPIDHVLLPVSASQSIYDYAKNNQDFQILADLIERADLVEALNGIGPRTIFAPTDQAFGRLQNNNNDWNGLINDQLRVRNLLLYHVLDGNVFAAELENRDTVQSVQGSDIDVRTNNGNDKIFLNDNSEITEADTLVKNGVYHTINRVLTPPPVDNPSIADLLEEQGLTVFVSAARRTGLLDTLANPSLTLTAFAAVNEGFYPEFSLYLNDYSYYLHLKAAMEYQVGDGVALWTGELTDWLNIPTLLTDEVLMVTQGTPNDIIINDESTITSPDLIGSNGALQVMDRVIVPPFYDTDIIDVVARQPATFSTLVYLLVLTGLIPDLSDPNGPYTLFAPTNQAFSDLLQTSGLLVGNDWTSNLDAMAEILKYHVVPGVVYAEQLTQNSTWTTLQGTTIVITIGDYYLDRRLTARHDLNRRLQSDQNHRDFHRDLEIHARPGSVINIDARATVLEKDMLASNGVVHSIDAVLVPTEPGWYDSITTLPTNEVCMQYAGFESICCPKATPSPRPNSQSVSTAEEPTVTSKQAKQEDESWFCSVMDLETGFRK